MGLDKLNSSAGASSEPKFNSFLKKQPDPSEMVCRPGDDPEMHFADEKQPFINEKKLVDTFRASAQKGSAEVTAKIVEITKAIPFAGDGNVKADLTIGVVDKNGFMDYGEKDLNVNLNGKINVKKDVFFNSLKALEGTPVRRSFKADVDIGKVNFDSKNQSYKIELKIDGLLFLNDDINLVVKADKNNNLVMSVEDKWLPDFLQSDTGILDEAKDKIAKELKKANFGLQTVIQDDKLYFLPKIEKQTIKLSNKESLRIDDANVNFSNTKFSINKSGDVNVELKNVLVTASNLGFDGQGKPIKEKSSGDIDFALVDISADINPTGNKQITVNKGQIFTGLDEKESEVIKIHGTSFNRHFMDAKLSIENLNGKINVDKSNSVVSSLGGNISVALNRPKNSIKMEGQISAAFNSAGDFSLAAKDMTVTHLNGVSRIKSLMVSDGKEGLKFEINEEEKEMPPLNVKTTKNDVDLIIGTDKFKKLLFDRVKGAKESINVESYLFSGDIGAKLTDELLLKSGGLGEKAGKLKIDNSAGVKVKLIFDSGTGDETPETHKSMIMIKQKYESIISDVKDGKGKFASLSHAEREKAAANIEKNMKWKLLDGGLSRIDHRKVTIIDGQNALTGGGINLTDSAMKKHDTMMDIWGPAVNRFQQEFIENWEEVAEKISEPEKKQLVKDERTLISVMKKHQKETGRTHLTDMQVLVTDDNQFQVYQKMVSEIRNAKKEINVEHAYFTDEKIKSELANALKKGVTVNVILPEYSDEGDIIHYGNLATLQDLKKASEEPNAGKFNAYLYKWDHKNDTGKFNHSKAMSFDGKTAIVGSANLTTRSLRGTLQGFLYNREMSEFISDKVKVAELNKSLFQKDVQPEFSKKLDENWFKDLEKEQAKIDKYKALQPLF